MTIEMVQIWTIQCSEMVHLDHSMVDLDPQIDRSRGQITCFGPILDPFWVHSGTIIWPISLIMPIEGHLGHGPWGPPVLYLGPRILVPYIYLRARA